MRYALLSLALLCFTAFAVNAQIPTQLLTAIQANDLATVKQLRPDSTMLNTWDAQYGTPLLWAAYKGDLSMVQYLIAQGANPLMDGAICLDDTCGGYYGNLLGVTAGEGKLEILKYFIEELNIPADDVEWNPKNGKKDGWTALTWACSKNRTKAALYLLKKNANPKTNNWIPLERSISNKNDTISKCLIPLYGCLDSISSDLTSRMAELGMDSFVYQILRTRINQEDYTAALSYYNLGEYFNRVSKFEKAYEVYGLYYAELEKKNESALGDYATKAIKKMSDIKFKLHEYEIADSLSLVWLRLSVHEVGDSSEEYAIRLRAYADNLMEHGLYEKAEKAFRDLLLLWHSLQGVKWWGVAVSKNNIGMCLNSQSRYQEAEPYLKESLALWNKFEQKKPEDQDVTMANLGKTLTELEKYEEAEQLLSERLYLVKNSYSEASEKYASVLNDLGYMYRRKKDYPKSEKVLLESLRIKSHLDNKNIYDYITTSENLADTYWEAKDYTNGAIVRQALADTLLGYQGWDKKIKMNYDWAATNYERLKKYEDAIIFYKKSLMYSGKIYAKTNFWYHDILNDIALCYYKKGDFDNARLFWQERIQYDTSSTTSMLWLGRLCKLNKKYSSALCNYRNVFDRLHKNILSEFRTEDKNSKYRYYKYTCKSDFDEIISLASIHYSDSIFQLAYDVALKSKNLILEESKQINHFVILSGNKIFQDSLNRLAEVQKVYANIGLGFHSNQKEEYSRKRILSNEIESLQKYLSKIFYESQPDLKKSFDAHWEDIQSALSPNEAAIEFIDFRLHFTDWTDTTLYAAIILRPGWDAPRFVTLFEEKALAVLLPDKQERSAAYAEKLYSTNGRSTPASPQKANLHQLIWSKLDTLLQGIKTVYYAPSGYLNRLNLGAIANQNKQMAAERYHLVQMASTRQLLQKRIETKPNRTAVLFGGLQYSADSIAISNATDKFRAMDSTNTRSYIDLIDHAATPMDTLEFTRSEVLGLVPIMKKRKYMVQVLTDLNGTEEALYALCKDGKSPAILHFSTHGFFFSDPANDSLATQRIVPFALSNSSMLRSGIVFSGCNRFWTTGKTYPGLHDGILTAYEAAQLDLTNTELVVLSACETALGDLNVEGGVFGLQRSFIQAGAHYVIMSLWKVDDFATKEFMATFYTKWLQEKMPIPDAFRATQFEMREKYQNPYFWAGFVLTE